MLKCDSSQLMKIWNLELNSTTKQQHQAPATLLTVTAALLKCCTKIPLYSWNEITTLLRKPITVILSAELPGRAGLVSHSEWVTIYRTVRVVAGEGRGGVRYLWRISISDPTMRVVMVVLAGLGHNGTPQPLPAPGRADPWRGGAGSLRHSDSAEHSAAFRYLK